MPVAPGGEGSAGEPGRDAPLQVAPHWAISAIQSYGAVLGLVAVTYVVASTAPGGRFTRAAVVLLQAATFLLALVAARPHRSLVVVGASLAAAIALVGVLGATLLPDAAGFTALAGVLLLALALGAVLAQLVRADRSSTELVLGAVDAYLLIGLLFAFVFAVLGSRDGFVHGAAREATNGDFLVFSYGNLSTLGSSNLVVVSNAVSSLAVLEAMLGQVFLVTVIARLVSLWASAPARRS